MTMVDFTRARRNKKKKRKKEKPKIDNFLLAHAGGCAVWWGWMSWCDIFIVRKLRGKEFLCTFYKLVYKYKYK